MKTFKVDLPVGLWLDSIWYQNDQVDSIKVHYLVLS